MGREKKPWDFRSSIIIKPPCLVTMIVINILVMWVKQGHKPAMTGNGETTTEKNLVMTGGWCVYDFF